MLLIVILVVLQTYLLNTSTSLSPNAEVDNNKSLLDNGELSILEEQGRYMRYVSLVETSIMHWNSNTLNKDEYSEMKQRLWRLLIVTCNSFATRLIEKRKFCKAMGKSLMCTYLMHYSSIFLIQILLPT